MYENESFTSWIKRILSGNKDASFGRAGAATVIYFLCMWSTAIVFKTWAIPFGPAFWFGLTTFLYLGGKSIEAYNNKVEVSNVNPATPKVPAVE